MTWRGHGGNIAAMVKKKEKPVVALVGDDEFRKNEELQALTESLGPEKDLEISELDGRETELRTILDELRTYPFLKPHRLVVVRNADSLGEGAEEPLVRYVENPVAFSTLVLVYSKLDGRSRLAKALKKHGRDVRIEHMREYQVPQWLMARAPKRYGKRLSAKDAAFLVEMVGANPGLLDSELSKIVSLSPDSKAIRSQDIEAVVTRGRAQTIFKLTEQIENKKKPEALSLLDQIIEQGIYDERGGGISTESAGIAPYLLHMINWLLNRLSTANRLLAEDEPEEEVSTQLKLYPRMRARFFSNLRRSWPPPECRRCHRELLLTDRRVKASRLEEVHVLLETLVISLCSRPKAQDTGARGR